MNNEVKRTNNSTNSKKMFKILFLGNSNTGKTSIIDSYLELPNNGKSTVGVEYKVKRIKDLELKKDFVFTIWDTAGQDRFRSIVSSYYKDSDAIVYVVDNSTMSMSPEDHSAVEYWFTEYHKYSYNKSNKPIVTFLVGNKIDTFENSDQLQEYKTRLAEIAIRFNMDNLLFTTIKNSDSIDKLFDQIMVELKSLYIDSIANTINGGTTDSIVHIDDSDNNSQLCCNVM